MTNKRIAAIVAAVLTTALILTPLWLAGDAGAGPLTVPPFDRLRTPLQQSGAPMLINYQGELTDTATGDPVPDGNYSITVTIYDAETGGSALWSETQTASVEDGLFSVLLGSQTVLTAGVFNGDPRWVGVKVESDAEMTPRQQVVSVAYAIQAHEAMNAASAPWSGLTGVPSGFADGVDDDTTYTAGTGLSLAGTQFSVGTTHRLPQSCANGQIAEWNNTIGTWQCGDDDTGAGGNFWSLTGNAGTTPGTNFLGTTDNQALELHVNGNRALCLEPNATSPNVIGGYSGNSVTAGVVGATIGGGGAGGNTNRVTDNYGTVAGGAYNRAGDNAGTTTDKPYATIGGGYKNTTSGYIATVGGGLENTASGYVATVGGGYGNTASGSYATVGGGNGNTASGVATVAGGQINTASGHDATIGGGSGNTASGWYATVGGGVQNTASSSWAAIAGGSSNTASGWYATVGGGSSNTAQGNYSFAAGRQAKANNQGCFVWGDSTAADVTCSVNNLWVARASGGVYFYTNSSLTSGMYLSAGGSAWNAVSDRERKENFGPVDAQELLARLAENPITTWNYKSQDPAIRHIGPMAQDFNALIDGLGGEGEDYINTLDADGVALAAIQGLYQLSQEQATRIEELETENAALQQQMDSLETRVAALEAGRCPEPVEGSPQSVQAGAFDGAQTKFLPGAGILLASLALGLLIRRGGVLRL